MHWKCQSLQTAEAGQYNEKLAVTPTHSPLPNPPKIHNQILKDSQFNFCHGTNYRNGFIVISKQFGETSAQTDFILTQ